MVNRCTKILAAIVFVGSIGLFLNTTVSKDVLKRNLPNYRAWYKNGMGMVKDLHKWIRNVTTESKTQPHIQPTEDPKEWMQAKATDPKFWDYGDQTCGGLNTVNRHIFINVLQRWINISETFNIDYMLNGGTLLGVWRNGDIIPWDYDMDIYVNRSDLAKLDNITDKRDFTLNWADPMKFKLILQPDWKKTYSKRRVYKCDGKRSYKNYDGLCGFRVLIGRLIGARDVYIDMYDISMWKGKVYDYSVYEKYFPYNELYPRKKCKFMGLTCYCPNNPFAILKMWYGAKNISQWQPNWYCKDKKWIKRVL